MKKLLLLLSFVLSLLISSQSFSQIPNTAYFGGIYDNKLYFNWVIHNTDTCYFIVETSEDGLDYQEIFCDSISPVPFPILHGVKIPTNENKLCVRLVAVMGGKIINFQPELFQAGKYTNIPKVPLNTVLPVYADL